MRTRPARLAGVSIPQYAVVFFVIAIIAALFGFSGIATDAAEIGKMSFVFVILAAMALITHAIRGK